MSNGEIFSFRLERGIKAGGEIGEGVMKGKEVSEEGIRRCSKKLPKGLGEGGVGGGKMRRTRWKSRRRRRIT